MEIVHKIVIYVLSDFKKKNHKRIENRLVKPKTYSKPIG